MALKKEIILENGIILNYHRIAEIQNEVNGKTKLLIYSYLNKDQRDREKQEKSIAQIYRVGSLEKLNYNDKLTITQAYEYLKTIDKYKDAEDVFENNEI